MVLLARGEAKPCPSAAHTRWQVAAAPSRALEAHAPGAPAFVLDLLRQFCAAPGHCFWSDQLSLRELALPGALFTHNQITDMYLLALAVNHGGKLVTFDRAIALSSVHGASDAHLQLL